MTIYLGVDGGSSKTHAALVDASGALLGFGTAGNANQNTAGLENALGEISRAVRMALAQAHADPGDVALGCFCLAGADFPDDFVNLRARLEGLGMAQKVIVKNDTAAGLRSGLSRSWGVVVVCGTGFNAAGRARDGRELGLPSYGPLTGDWGGGGDLGVEVVGAVMRARDGRGRPTLLTQMVLDALKLATTDELLQAIHLNRLSHRQVLELTPLLFEAAHAGDAVASELVVRMGNEVGLTANVFLERLDLAGTDAEVVLTGSIFKGRGPLLLDTVRKAVHALSPQARIVRPVLEPVAGAALLALELAGVAVTAQTNQRMQTAASLAIPS